jgi:hypothetical protein
MIMFPAMGRIRDASRIEAADPFRFPECLATRAHTVSAAMIAKNTIPNASLKPVAPSLYSHSAENQYDYNITF